MADTQQQILIDDFTQQIDHEVQQMQSFFRGKIMERPVKGEIFEIQNLGGTTAREQVDRFEKITYSNANHERRGALIKTFYDAIPIERQDALESIVDINSGYSKTLAASMMRALDNEVAKKAIGKILTGAAFATETTASTDGVATVTAGSGVTYEKLTEVYDQITSTGVGLSGEKLYFACTNVQARTLMQEVEAVSKDFGNTDTARNGKLPQLAGFNIIVFPSNPTTGASIINKTGSTRQCFAFSEDAIQLGMLSGVEARYERINDAVDAHHLVITSRFAAARTQGARVVQVNVTEA